VGHVTKDAEVGSLGEVDSRTLRLGREGDVSFELIAKAARVVLAEATSLTFFR